MEYFKTQSLNLNGNPRKFPDMSSLKDLFIFGSLSATETPLFLLGMTPGIFFPSVVLSYYFQGNYLPLLLSHHLAEIEDAYLILNYIK